MLQLKARVSGSTVAEEKITEILEHFVKSNNLDALMSIVVRVEVFIDKITIWTLLDADPNGHFDFSDKGLIISLGNRPPAPDQKQEIDTKYRPPVSFFYARKGLVPQEL